MLVKSVPARIAAAAAAVGALVLAGAAPAAAVPTDEDVLYAVHETDTGSDTFETFAVVDQSTGVHSPFAPTLPDGYSTAGIEVHDGVGYAVLRDGDGDAHIATWNPETGQPGAPVALSWSGGAVEDVRALDTIVNGDLADGTMILLAELNDGVDVSTWVATVNPVSGALTARVDVSDDGLPQYRDSLATDPTTGITYLMVDDDDGMPQYAALDLVAGTWSTAVELSGIQDGDSAGSGYMGGADFDADGILWFHYVNDNLYRTDGAFGAEVTATLVGPTDDTADLGSLTIGSSSDESEEPAPTDEGTLYTVLETDIGASTVENFAVVDQGTAATTPFVPTLPAGYGTGGIEVHDGVGYVVLQDEDDGSPSLAEWDPETGVVGAPIALTWSGGVVDGGWALDTVVNGSVPDGTMILIVQLDDGSGQRTWVASVDPATGALTPLVDVTGGDVPQFLDSLATDPTTGISYLMADDDDGMPQYLVLGLDSGTFEPPVELTGIQDSAGESYMGGADFDAEGHLWFLYSSDDLHVTDGSFGASVTSTLIGLVGGDVDFSALTIVPAAETEPEEPTLPATGSDAGAIGSIGGFAAALLALGALGLGLTARRRVVHA